ncbi:transcriptional regulator [Thermococcus chitonophagus]|uniref:Transcriptional regulator n=2 Tax=Thermococcus chitonophagus TaxID=54262 RepID=A0A2Z2N659_9EURY|nr:transcriptional regulator [Thermococcus chitonophagus]
MFEYLSERESVEIELLKRIFRGILDETDIKIYMFLRENGKISDSEIARRLGISVTTVRRRRKRLEEKGLLQIVGLLLLKAADIQYADVLVKFRQGVRVEEINEFINTAVNNPRIYEVTVYIGGEYDVLLRFFESNLERLKYHIEKFVRSSDIIEHYTINTAIGSPKAWYKVFKIKIGNNP